MRGSFGDGAAAVTDAASGTVFNATVICTAGE
jgi:hypothetical protein